MRSVWVQTSDCSFFSSQARGALIDSLSCHLCDGYHGPGFGVGARQELYQAALVKVGNKFSGRTVVGRAPGRQDV